VRFYAVVVDPLEEAIEIFTERREAERVVENWNRDEPDRPDRARHVAELSLVLSRRRRLAARAEGNQMMQLD
jgi:hypothetical protein